MPEPPFNSKNEDEHAFLSEVTSLPSYEEPEFPTPGDPIDRKNSLSFGKRNSLMLVLNRKSSGLGEAPFNPNLLTVTPG